MRSCRVLASSAKYARLQYGHAGVSWQPLSPRAALAPASSCQDGHIRQIQNSSYYRSYSRNDNGPLPTKAPAPDTSHPLSEQLRTLMRRLTHPVVVCTATHPPAPHQPSPAPNIESPPSSAAAEPPLQLRGMTISSFTSLALRPAPLVTFNIAQPSRTLDALAASRQFNVHVLAGTPQGAAVAELFTRGNADEDAVFERLSGQGEEERGCRLAGAARIEEGDGIVGLPPAPVLVGPGILYVLRCRLVDEPSDGLVKVQDHVIVLGEVIAIEEGQPAGKNDTEGKTGGDRRVGLAYSDRRYRRQGTPLEHGKDER